MLLTPGNSFSFYATNAGSPSATPGTSLTASGTPNTEGSWVEVVSAANLSHDVYWVSVGLNSGASAGSYRAFRVDLGVDNAGGTSYTAIVSDMIASGCNSSALQSGGGINFCFPIFIKAGSSVAVRVQSNTAIAAVRCVVEVFGRPSAHHLVNVGTFSETIGLGAAPAATAFTPGNSGANGAWVSLGTTTNPMFWFQLGVQCTATTMALLGYTFDLSYGDVSNKTMIIEDKRITTGNAECMGSFCDIGGLIRCQQYVPAGSTLYVRGSCSGTADSGWQAACVGVG